MDPTPDPAPDQTVPSGGVAPLPDLAAVIARVARIEQRLAALEVHERAILAGLPAPDRRNPPIVPIHTVAAPPPSGAGSFARPVGPPPLRPPISALIEAAPAMGIRHEAAPPAEPWGALPPSGWHPSRTEPGAPSFRLPAVSTLSPGRLLAWVGGAALVLGAVFFLSLAFTRGWITPEMRVLLGLVGGAALLGMSVVTFDRRGPVLAHVLAAAGIAILELALYAARLFELIGPELALGGTAIVAASGTAIAIRFDSQPIAALGLLAVLAAPPIMEAPASLMTVGFLFIVLVGGCTVAVARGWRWLPWLAFGVTVPQLAAWLRGGDAPVLAAAVVLLGYWMVLAGAAAAEMWRRPRAVRHDPSGLLLVLLDVAVVLLIGLASDDTAQAGFALLALGGLHLAGAAPFLLRRDTQDPHGQLLLGAAAPWLTLGIGLALPELFVPVGWAVLAAALGLLAARWRHDYARIEGLLVAALLAAWVGIALYPLESLLTHPFPPLGEGRHGTAESLALIGALLVIIAAAVRWSARTRFGRSAIAASGVALIAWTLPFETSGLVLVAAWVMLTTVTLTGTVQLFRVRLQRMTVPIDPLLWMGILVGAAAVTWGVVGFPRPEGVVDLLAPIVTDRIVASLLPVVGLIAFLFALRPRWWRGATAATMLLLLTLGAWMVAGAAVLVVGGPFAARIEGTLVVLVGWSAMALLALVLDERPRLRLASVPLLTADPVGHPLALTASVPAIATLAWLASRFLVGGSGGGLPVTPFTDEKTVATGLVVAFLLLAARAARTSLVRTVLVATAVVLVALLLPLEVAPAYAVLGWSVMAAVALLIGRARVGGQARTAFALAAGLIATGIAVTLLVIAPPDRLFLEITRVPPEMGPPNAATLATLALAGALAVAARCSRGVARLAPWLWLGAGGALAWGVSMGIADAFAVRIPGGADPLEMARQAQVALSIAWATMGLGTMLLGLLLDIGPARQAGLTLLAIATLKVFLYDLATLDIAYRVLSLVGLGVLLLVSAWLDLHARHRGGPQAMSH